MKHFTVEVKVTQDHINKATKGDCAYCVIALAVRDAVAKLKKIAKSKIEISTISFDTAIRINGKGGTSYSAQHPQHIATLIYAFDGGKPVEPTTFTATFLEKNIQWKA